MKTKPAYVLIPASGEDVLRSFDGASASVELDTQACQRALHDGVRPLLAPRGAYELPASPEDSCLAAHAAARTGHMVGLDKLAQVLVQQHQDPRTGALLLGQVANDLGLSPDAQPAGPSLPSRPAPPRH